MSGGRDLVAVELRHGDVEQGEIGYVLTCQSECGCPVTRDDRLEAVIRQAEPHELEDVLVVVRNQHGRSVVVLCDTCCRSCRLLDWHRADGRGER